MRSRLLVVTLLLTAGPLQAAPVQRLLYVAAPGIRDYLEYGGAGLLVFDIDKGHTFVERIATTASEERRPANIKGICASPATGRLYFTTPKTLYAVDLGSKKTLWDKRCPVAATARRSCPTARPSTSPRSRGIPGTSSMPTANRLRTLKTRSGAHNTVAGLDGKRVYLGGLKSNDLWSPTPVNTYSEAAAARSPAPCDRLPSTARRRAPTSASTACSASRSATCTRARNSIASSSRATSKARCSATAVPVTASA